MNQPSPKHESTQPPPAKTNQHNYPKKESIKQTNQAYDSTPQTKTNHATNLTTQTTKHPPPKKTTSMQQTNLSQSHDCEQKVHPPKKNARLCTRKHVCANTPAARALRSVC